MNDIAINKLLKSIKKINNVSQPNNLVFGTVKSIDPISVEISPGVVLPESNLFLGQMCRPYKVKIPHTHELNGKTEKSKATAAIPPATNGGDLKITGQATAVEVTGHSHEIKKQITEDVHKQGTDFEESVTIEIEPKLKVGDKVLMFAFNNYQYYYVAERIEEE